MPVKAVRKNGAFDVASFLVPKRRLRAAPHGPAVTGMRVGSLRLCAASDAQALQGRALGEHVEVHMARLGVCACDLADV